MLITPIWILAYVCGGVKADIHHDFHSFVFGTRGAGDECEGL